MQDYEPERHGDNYSHRFICKKIKNGLSICFYIIEGYETLAENLSFEHAFFVIDDFLGFLLDTETPSDYLAFADVGHDIEDDEFLDYSRFGYL